MSATKVTKTSFSGHEKFECKMSWLPLAYKDIDAINDNLETAITITGLGSNKVKSLRQWITKLTLLDGGNFTEHAELIFSNDPYLEKLDSLWILHVYITQNIEKATLYHLFFNEFYMPTFTKESLLDRTQIWCEQNIKKMSKNTLESDVSVFINMYLKKNTKNEYSSSLFGDLNLLNKVDNEYVLNIKNASEISDNAFLYIFLYFIRNHEGKTISIKDLQVGNRSLQYTLALTEEKLLEKLEGLTKLSNGAIVYQEAAGIKQIYIEQTLKLNEALANIYK